MVIYNLYIINLNKMTTFLIYFVLKLTLNIPIINSDQNIIQPFKVKCPQFDNDPSPNLYSYSLESMSNYCRCQLHSTFSGKTAIIKCDFEYKEDIIITEELFPFKFYNSTSAYVRMTNCRSAYLTSTFLYKWMEAPSSAVDIWNCGNIKIESSVEPPKFEKIQTFIGVGIANSTIETFPSHFLRDRTRGALRFKECNIGTISKGIFHNIKEMRYFVIEHSYIRTVEGPLSNSGVIQLSRKSLHSWDGLEIINTTIDFVSTFSFHIAHKSDMEDFIINGSTFGKIATEAFSAVGDINVQIINNKFLEIEANAFQISVNGTVKFEENLVEKFRNESLSGISCNSKVSLDKNTFYVPYKTNNLNILPFNRDCGSPKVSFMVQNGPSNSTSVIILILFGLLATLIIIIGLLYGTRTKSFILYRLKRSETPLFEEEIVPEMECSKNRHEK